MTDTVAYLTQDEAAKLLRLSPRSLERFRVSGTGPKFVKASRRVLYRRADIEAWAAARTFASTAEADTAHTT
jgi:predicted DNA-binding transcriptional regulator AlpA